MIDDKICEECGLAEWRCAGHKKDNEHANQLYFMTLRGQSEYGANLIMESLMLVGIDSTCSFGYNVATAPMDMDALAYLVGMVNKQRVQFSIVGMEDAGD